MSTTEDHEAIVSPRCVTANKQFVITCYSPIKTLNFLGFEEPQEDTFSGPKVVYKCPGKTSNA